jgi:hypothetical protein
MSSAWRTCKGRVGLPVLAGRLPAVQAGYVERETVKGLLLGREGGVEVMDPGERIAGTRDEHYNLASVLYHALQGAETIEAYVLDAEAAGDERLADFFREAQATHRQLAERAKRLLGILEVPPEPEVAPDVPLEGGISPGAMSGGIPPQSADFQQEPDVRADEIRTPTEEVPPMADMARSAPGVAPLPDEDIVAEAGGVPGTPQPAETPGEPSRRPERRTAGQTEGEQQEEKKGLIDKIADKLTGR